MASMFQLDGAAPLSSKVRRQGPDLERCAPGTRGPVVARVNVRCRSKVDASSSSSSSIPPFTPSASPPHPLPPRHQPEATIENYTSNTTVSADAVTLAGSKKATFAARLSEVTHEQRRPPPPPPRPALRAYSMAHPAHHMAARSPRPMAWPGARPTPIARLSHRGHQLAHHHTPSEPDHT